MRDIDLYEADKLNLGWIGYNISKLKNMDRKLFLKFGLNAAIAVTSRKTWLIKSLALNVSPLEPKCLMKPPLVISWNLTMQRPFHEHNRRLGSLLLRWEG